MHVHVQKFTTTTWPRSSAVPSGSELSHSVAPANAGRCTRSNRVMVSAAIEGRCGPLSEIFTVRVSATPLVKVMAVRAPRCRVYVRGSLPYAASAWRGGQPASVWPEPMIFPRRAGLYAEYRLTGG